MENKPFAVWQISENESVNLVLEAAQICELENKLGGRNLMSAIGNNDTGMPSLRTMMLVTHAALQRFNHGKQMSDVYSMYDRYIANGGSQVDFYAGVYVPIFQASVFFPREQADELAEKLEDLKA